MTAVLSRLLTANEVAELLSVHPRTVHRLRKQGLLPAVAIFGTWRYDPTDIRRYIKQQKGTTP